MDNEKNSVIIIRKLNYVVDKLEELIQILDSYILDLNIDKKINTCQGIMKR